MRIPWEGPYLLSEADARPGVERQKDERIRRQVLVQAFIEEAIWIKEVRWKKENRDRAHQGQTVHLVIDPIKYSPSGPHRSFLRCIRNTL